MIDRLLKTHLNPIARKHRRWRLLRDLSLGWLALAGVGLLFILARHSAGLTLPWLFPVLVIALLAWTILIWRRSRREMVDYQALARKIEQDHPDLHALLLTAVEQKPNQATGGLNYLQERVIREALAMDRKSQWRQHASHRLHLMQLGNVAALALLAAVLFALYRVAPPRMALHMSQQSGVTVTPGDTSVEKGSSLVVLARFNGQVPSEAVLVVRPANEPERRIQLTKNLDDPVFGTSLPQVKDELTYRVEYDGDRTRDFRVTTYEYPQLERADAKITFPEYTGLKEKTIEDTLRISAVEGSTLDYTFHINKPVRTAAWVAKDGESIELVGDTNRPNAYSTNLKLLKSARYDLVLVDDEGRTNKVPPQFVLDVLTNRTPELKFASPRGDQRVSALEEITFKGEASDDFGLKAYGIAYNLAGKETKFIELGQSAGPHEKRRFDQLVALESLGAQPDDLLSYYLWADDIGPDGNVRRTAGDMYFAEVRPFEEIFREGQPQDANQAAQQRQQQGQQGQNASERLAEIQKQIITATWNLQRRETGKTPSSAYKPDTSVVKESQENVLEQVRSRGEGSDDPRSTAMSEAVEKAMQNAIDHLADAVDHNSTEPLPDALSSEQSAYQSLLRLAAREFQVSQARNGQQGNQSSRGARAQRQLDQLDLRQTQNRYETERQALPPQDPQRREQLQAFNRLKELAQRQQDVNDRLKELQTALQEARTEAERQEIQDRLKRLQEEQQQLLADVDELRQRMAQPENQSQMAEARQQLDQTRPDVQQAAQALEQGNVSQALSSGTRAQRDLQQLRDDFRRQSSSEFAEDMREMRSQARDLAQQQQDIGTQLDELNDPTRRQSLTDSEERNNLAKQLDEQKQRMDDLIKHATEVTQQAETSEPLLSRQLYDTIRKASQNQAQDIQQTTDDLLSQGRMYRSVYDMLQNAKDQSQRPVEVTANLLRQGFSTEAGNLEQRARRSINDLRDGIDRAAQSVLGDDTEALRLARNEVDALTDQLEREINQAQGQRNTNSVTAANANGQNAEQLAAANQRQQNGQPSGQRGRRSGQNSQQPGDQDQPSQQADQASAQGGQRSGQNGQQQGQRQGQGGQPGDQAQQPSGQRGQGEQQLASGRGGGGNNDNQQPDPNRNGQRNGGRQTGGRDFLDQLGGGGPRDDLLGGPITGPGYTQWSDRLRDVEELLDVPDLRSQAARIRDRARAVRLDLKRHAQEPQWDMVQLEIAGPLVELRSRISEELARRESKDALVPVDRDPVPSRYAELVRQYYEQLGKSEPATPPKAGDAK